MNNSSSTSHASSTVTPAPLRGILLDIEGTTSSIRFVVDVMFPFVREHLDRYLEQAGVLVRDAALDRRILQEARELGWTDPLGSNERWAARLTSAVLYLMDRDAKVTGLKELQGQIWERGFHDQNLVAHVYPEVPQVLRDWRAAGFDLRIYSSGSVAAQRLFFGHTTAGDLLPLFSQHYDTQIGGKKDAQSYQLIAAEYNFPPSEILFLSDSVDELRAAQAAGLQTVLSQRPENPVPPPDHGFAAITSFSQLRCELAN